MAKPIQSNSYLTVGELKKLNKKQADTNHLLRVIADKLDAIGTRQQQQGDQMALDLSRIESEVAENTDATQSAVSLLDTLAEEIRNNTNDPAALNALADALSGNSDRLAAAVTRNTPAAPA
jgi:hypothetical protein